MAIRAAFSLAGAGPARVVLGQILADQLEQLDRVQAPLGGAVGRHAGYFVDGDRDVRILNPRGRKHLAGAAPGQLQQLLIPRRFRKCAQRKLGRARHTGGRVETRIDVLVRCFGG